MAAAIPERLVRFSTDSDVRFNSVDWRRLSSEERRTVINLLKGNTRLRSFGIDYFFLDPLDSIDSKLIAELLEANTSLESLSLCDNKTLDRASFNLILEAAKGNTHLRSLNLDRCKLDSDNLKSLIELLQVNTTITSVRLDSPNPQVEALLMRNRLIQEGGRAIAETESALHELHQMIQKISLEVKTIFEPYQTALESIRARLARGKAYHEELRQKFSPTDEGNYQELLTYLNQYLGEARGLKPGLEEQSNQVLGFSRESNVYINLVRWRSFSSEARETAVNLLKGNTHLRSLDFTWCNLDPIDAKLIAELLETNTSLESLAIWGNETLGREGFNLILEAAKRNTHLRSLSFGWCNLDSINAKLIAELLETNTSLEFLDLHGNNTLGREGFNLILEAAKRNTHLRSLDLSWCRLDPVDAKLIAELLEANTFLESLSLGGRRQTLGREGFNLILEAAKRNTHLRSLNLRECKLDSDNLKSLIELLQVNTTITSVRLDSPNPYVEALLARNWQIQGRKEKILIRNIETVLGEWGNRVAVPLDIVELFLSREEVEIYKKHLAQKSTEAVERGNAVDLKKSGERGDFKAGEEAVRVSQGKETKREPAPSLKSVVVSRQAPARQEARQFKKEQGIFSKNTHRFWQEASESLEDAGKHLQTIEEALNKLKEVPNPDQRVVTLEKQLKACQDRLANVLVERQAFLDKGIVQEGGKLQSETNIDTLEGYETQAFNLLESARNILDNISNMASTGSLLEEEPPANAVFAPLAKTARVASEKLSTTMDSRDEFLGRLKATQFEREGEKDSKSSTENNTVVVDPLERILQEGTQILTEGISATSTETGKLIASTNAAFQEMEQIVLGLPPSRASVFQEAVQNIQAKLLRASKYHEELVRDLIGIDVGGKAFITPDSIQYVLRDVGGDPEAQQLGQSVLQPLKNYQATYQELLSYLKSYQEEIQNLKAFALEKVSSISQESARVISETESVLHELHQMIQKTSIETKAILEHQATLESLSKKFMRGKGYHEELSQNLSSKEEGNYQELLTYLHQYLEEARSLKPVLQVALAEAELEHKAKEEQRSLAKAIVAGAPVSPLILSSPHSAPSVENKEQQEKSKLQKGEETGSGLKA